MPVRAPCKDGSPCRAAFSKWTSWQYLPKRETLATGIQTASGRSVPQYSSAGCFIHICLSDSGQLWTRLRNLSDSHTTRVTGAFSPSKLSNPPTHYPKRCSPVETYRTGNERIACTHVPLNEVAPWLRDLDSHVADSATVTG